MEKKMKKISFIIPVHNIAKWIGECLDSILKQNNVADFEVLLIDDGSLDESKEICLKYTSKYNFIKYYYQDCSGVSVARNYGLEKACGEYICFLDGDDFYLKDFANDFYLICKQNDLDIIRGRCCTYKEVSEEFITYDVDTRCFNQVLSGTEFLNKTMKYKTNEVVPWLGLFKRSFLIENSLSFPKGIGYEEDHLFFLEALLFAKKVMAVDDVFYAYRFRADSASKKYSVNQVKDALFIVNKELSLIKEERNSLIRKNMYKYCSASFYQITSIYGRVTKGERAQIRREIKNNNITPFTFKSYYNLHQKFKIIIFLLFPHILALFYSLRKR